MKVGSILAQTPQPGAVVAIRASACVDVKAGVTRPNAVVLIAPAERPGLVRVESIRVAADCQTHLYSPWFQADTLLMMSGVK